MSLDHGSPLTGVSRRTDDTESLSIKSIVNMRGAWLAFFGQRSVPERRRTGRRYHAQEKHWQRNDKDVRALARQGQTGAGRGRYP